MYLGDGFLVVRKTQICVLLCMTYFKTSVFHAPRLRIVQQDISIYSIQYLQDEHLAGGKVEEAEDNVMLSASPFVLPH